MAAREAEHILTAAYGEEHPRSRGRGWRGGDAGSSTEARRRGSRHAPARRQRVREDLRQRQRGRARSRGQPRQLETAEDSSTRRRQDYRAGPRDHRAVVGPGSQEAASMHRESRTTSLWASKLDAGDRRTAAGHRDARRDGAERRAADRRCADRARGDADAREQGHAPLAPRPRPSGGHWREAACRRRGSRAECRRATALKNAH